MDKNIGKKYGRLTIISLSHMGKYGEKYYLCKCDCGNRHIANLAHLRSGHTKSCGCYQREVSVENGHIVKHGKSNTRLYKIWAGMKTRCTNPNSDHKRDYYDRGIIICDEWKNDFMNFYNWAMEHGYDNHLTLDRKDFDGNYEPSNCRWATPKQQTENRKCAILISIGGVTRTLKEWSERCGIPYITLYWRYTHGNSLKIYDGKED